MANDYQDKNGSGAGDWIYWVVSLLALVKLPPVGILMLAARLFGGDKKRKKTKKGRHPYYMQQEANYEAPAGARTVNTSAAPSAPSAAPVRGNDAVPAQKRIPNKGRGLIVGGSIMMGVFLFAFFASISDAFRYFFMGEMDWMISELADLWPLVCFSAGGAGMLWVGLRQQIGRAHV